MDRSDVPPHSRQFLVLTYPHNFLADRCFQQLIVREPGSYIFTSLIYICLQSNNQDTH